MLHSESGTQHMPDAMLLKGINLQSTANVPRLVSDAWKARTEFVIPAKGCRLAVLDTAISRKRQMRGSSPRPCFRR
jgi:hypothetical protein